MCGLMRGMRDRYEFAEPFSGRADGLCVLGTTARAASADADHLSRSARRCASALGLKIYPLVAAAVAKSTAQQRSLYFQPDSILRNTESIQRIFWWENLNIL